MAVYGSSGQIAWFFAFIYMWIREACRRSFYIKLLVHIIGLISMIVGLYFLIEHFLFPLSIIGIALGLFGLVIFFTPFNLTIK